MKRTPEKHGHGHGSFQIPVENTHHSLITDGVPESEQTLHASRPFWVFLGGNTGIATWLIGVLIARLGLDIEDALFVILFGSIVGSLLPAIMATLGPKTRLSQIEASRFALGRTGKKFAALLNWANTIGWDVINNVISASALVVMLAGFGVQLPLWLSLLILVGVQFFIGGYGHHLIQGTARFTGLLLGLCFLVMGIASLDQIGLHGQAEPPDGAIHNVISAFLLLVAFNVGWASVTADYTRYLPRSTPARKVFMSVFGSLFLSLAMLAVFGYFTASAIREPTPAGVMQGLESLSGHFAPLVLAIIWFAAIPANALNDNSAAYSLLSVGFRFSRLVSASLGSVIGFVVSLLASNAFLKVFEELLFLYAHWVVPWAAVILVHWFTVGRRSQRTADGMTTGFTVVIAVTVLSVLLFSENPVYTGPVAEWFGGLDIGPYVGFVTAGGVYYALIATRLTRRRKH